MPFRAEWWTDNVLAGYKKSKYAVSHHPAGCQSVRPGGTLALSWSPSEGSPSPLPKPAPTVDPTVGEEEWLITNSTKVRRDWRLSRNIQHVLYTNQQVCNHTEWKNQWNVRVSALDGWKTGTAPNQKKISLCCVWMRLIYDQYINKMVWDSMLWMRMLYYCISAYSSLCVFSLFWVSDWRCILNKRKLRQYEVHWTFLTVWLWCVTSPSKYRANFKFYNQECMYIDEFIVFYLYFRVISVFETILKKVGRGG